jgi:hypothetical protein
MNNDHHQIMSIDWGNMAICVAKLFQIVGILVYKFELLMEAVVLVLSFEKGSF